MSQIEREYREALDALCFPGEGKERIMKNLMDQREAALEKPAKRRGARPLRMALAAAAVCAALVVTAGAATFVSRQARINFFDSYEEAADAARRDGPGADNGVIGFLIQDLEDYDEMGGLDMERWWNGEPGQTLVEEADGGPEDGWTARRVFQGRFGDQTYLFHKYKAERLSDLNNLWDVWDTAWLEEHYTFSPETLYAEQMELDGAPDRLTLIGEFRGQGGAVFNIQYSWRAGQALGDQSYLREGLDHHEVYTTADGVEATIMTATTHSGKTAFWVNAIFGYGNFSMFGNEVELDELYPILDSLHLSKMLEVIPAEISEKAPSALAEGAFHIIFTVPEDTVWGLPSSPSTSRAKFPSTPAAAPVRRAPSPSKLTRRPRVTQWAR